MQYLYTQEEHDALKQNRDFEKSVAIAAEAKLKEARERTRKVIEDFYKSFRHALGDPFGANIDFRTLRTFLDKLQEANQLPKESCDKDQAQWYSK